MPRTITVDQWQRELERMLARPDDEGQTTNEIAAEMGRSIGWVRARLNTLKARGRLVVGTRRIERLDGAGCSVKVYSVKAVANGKK